MSRKGFKSDFTREPKFYFDPFMKTSFIMIKSDFMGWENEQKGLPILTFPQSDF